MKIPVWISDPSNESWKIPVNEWIQNLNLWNLTTPGLVLSVDLVSWVGFVSSVGLVSCVGSVPPVPSVGIGVVTIKGH